MNWLRRPSNHVICRHIRRAQEDLESLALRHAGATLMGIVFSRGPGCVDGDDGNLWE
jgi:hypothetical protein